MDEEFYIKGLHTGDQKIFREIFEAYHTRLCYFAASLLASDQEAEDLVQEAFVKLWQKRVHFQSLNSIKAFLYITVKNHCLNIYKHGQVVKKFSRLSHEAAEQGDVMGHMIEAEVFENVYQALQKLPSSCGNILKLSYFEEMKNKEIASLLQISINTVKTQKKRGLHLLRSIMKVSTMWFLLLLNQCF